MKNGDIPGLAEAMMKVMGDEALRKRMSEEAKKVTETYSEEKVMKQWIKLFQSLIGRDFSDEVLNNSSSLRSE